MPLFTQYHERGLEILAFPCNQFGGQEPGTAREIKKFVAKYNFKGTLMEKVDVNGPQTSSVYQYLKRATNSANEDIQWNFNTIFLIDAEGNVGRHNGHSPLSLAQPIKKLLASAQGSIEL